MCAKSRWSYTSWLILYDQLLLKYQSLIKGNTIKLQTNTFPPINIDIKVLNKILANSLSATCKKNYTSCLCGVYTRNASLVQHIKSINVINHSDRIYDTSHMIRKKNWQNPRPLMINIPTKLGVGENSLSLTMDIYYLKINNKSQLIQTKWWKFKSFHSKIRN